MAHAATPARPPRGSKCESAEPPRLAALAGDAAGALRGRPSVINSRRYAELASEGFVCRVDRLRERLGVVAQIGLREGLADAYAWYVREGWL